LEVCTVNFDAHVFADTREMTREEWLEKRKQGIGGSEASAIMGLNPYSSPLRVYLDKIGKAEEKITTEAMRQGTDLEAYVADRFTEETGMKVRKVNKILQHPNYPWMLANIDRDIVGYNAGLECKTTSPYSKFKFDEGEINPHYYWQSMHYMAVTGAKKWYVAVLVLGKSFHVFEIDRDEKAINQLINAENDFWVNHVLKKDPPVPTGGDADDEALTDMYPVGEDDADEVDLDSFETLLDLRELTVKRRDELDTEVKEYDQQLKRALGKSQHGASAKWRVNWTNTTRNAIDGKMLREKYPEIAEEVTKATTSRRFSVARMKED
jgi:putative phage-type endonuclease